MKKFSRTMLLAIGAMLLAAAPLQADDLTPKMGEDGVYHFDWYHQSFLELQDDINEAVASGKVLMVKFDQKGCIYCEKVALDVLTDPVINKYVRDNFMVVQLDIFGNRDVTDIDGTVLPESEMAQRWGVVFTPSIYFIAEPPKGDQLPQAAAAVMPGAFGKITFFGMLQWVKSGAYKTEPRFQKYYGDNFEALRDKIKAGKAS